MKLEDVIEIFVIDSFFFFSSRRRHTRLQGDWSSDVCSSNLTDLDADGAGLIEEQPGPAGDFRGNRTVIAQVRHRVAEVLADQRDLGRSIAEREACIKQAVGRPLARYRAAVTRAEAAADVGVVDLAHEAPGVADRHRVRQRAVAGPVRTAEPR